MPCQPHSPHIYKYGEQGSGIRVNTFDGVQDFEKIKKKCLANGQLFEDNHFPAHPNSLFYSTGEGAKFKWKRPHEICDNPMFIKQGASRFDVLQGELGDCWLLAAVANLTLSSSWFGRVVPNDQGFQESDEYAGIFHFRFWQYGRWVDVCIDDRLPTLNNQLVFMHSTDRNEFWSALVEKAYAKIHGSYEALKGGSFGEAMEDFTGGISEFYQLDQINVNGTANATSGGGDGPGSGSGSKTSLGHIYMIMKQAANRGSFMGCSVNALSPAQQEKKLDNGIVMGHAYSITAVKEVQLETARVKGKIPLVRMRNPWGNEAEWNGAWSDGSREWTIISDEEKRKLGLQFTADGEFWMSFQDFKATFTNLEICNLTPDDPLSLIPKGLGSLMKSKCWEAHLFEGAWIAGVSAGGCRNNLATFAQNPQYLVTLVDHDDDDDENLCTLIIALMQKNRRWKKKMGLDTLTIGFAVYEVKSFAIHQRTPLYTTGFQRVPLLNTDYFRYNSSVARSPNFINLREVTARVKLAPGRYCVVPSTFDPNEEGEFILRLFTEKPTTECCENDEEIGFLDDQMMNNSGGDHPPDDDNRVNEDRTRLKPTPYMKEPPKEAIEAPPEVKAMFARIAGEDCEVDSVELRDILNYSYKKQYKFDGFSLDACRSMIAMMDTDRSGKLGVDEFIQLYRKLRQWRHSFDTHDVDKSGFIAAHELQSALAMSRIKCNRRVLQALVLRYGEYNSKTKFDRNAPVKPERTLTFDSFLLCCIKLVHFIEVFRANNSGVDKLGENAAAKFTMDEFIERVMYS